MEILWKKSSKSGGNDGGTCVWVAEVAPLREKLGGQDAPLEICGERIRNTTDVVVRDEFNKITQYTYGEFAVFILGVKKGDFDYLLKPGVLAVEKELKDDEISIPIKHGSDLNGNFQTIGGIRVNSNGNISGQITSSKLLEILQDGSVVIHALYTQFDLVYETTDG